MVRYDRRKVVVATNVAETSLTIDGVRLVIDSGLARIPRYDPYPATNTLLIEKLAAPRPISGPAARDARRPGHCLRLWTAHEQAARPAPGTLGGETPGSLGGDPYPQSERCKRRAGRFAGLESPEAPVRWNAPESLLTGSRRH